MARPKIKIDEVQLEKLAMMQCTTQEIASFFNCSVDTIDRRFADIIKKGRDMGNISMKRRLFGLVEKENLGAIIWWGKNYCGMSDKVEQKTDVVLEDKTTYVASWGTQGDTKK